jgi:hypothetical protein
VKQAQTLSDVLIQLPVVATGYVYVARAIEAEAKAWLEESRGGIITTPKEI